MRLLRKIKLDVIFISSVYAALGVLILLWPEETQRVMCYLLALLLLAVGICFSVDYLRKEVQVDERSYSLAFSLSALIAGIVAFVYADEIVDRLNFVLSFLVLFSGFMKLQNAWDMKKLEYSGKLVHLILALISVALGGVLLLGWVSEHNPEVWIGVGLIYGGFTDLISSFTLSKVRRDAERKQKEAEL